MIGSETLQGFKQSLPELKYLAVYDLPRALRWGYDYASQAFLPAASPEKPPFAQDDFVSELIQYSQAIEFSLRCGEQVIRCVSARDNINAKLLEIWLARQSEAILSIEPPPADKPAPKPKSSAKSRPQAKTAPAKPKRGGKAKAAKPAELEKSQPDWQPPQIFASSSRLATPTRRLFD